jgi:hypothetical protein
VHFKFLNPILSALWGNWVFKFFSELLKTAYYVQWYIWLNLVTNVAGDELIAPCMCKGTQQLVHRGCLDHWRSVKVRMLIHFLSISDIFYPSFSPIYSQATSLLAGVIAVCNWLFKYMQCSWGKWVICICEDRSIDICTEKSTLLPIRTCLSMAGHFIPPCESFARVGTWLHISFTFWLPFCMSVYVWYWQPPTTGRWSQWRSYSIWSLPYMLLKTTEHLYDCCYWSDYLVFPVYFSIRVSWLRCKYREGLNTS